MSFRSNKSEMSLAEDAEAMSAILVHFGRAKELLFNSSKGSNECVNHFCSHSAPSLLCWLVHSRLHNWTTGLCCTAFPDPSNPHWSIDCSCYVWLHGCNAKTTTFFHFCHTILLIPLLMTCFFFALTLSKIYFSGMSLSQWFTSPCLPTWMPWGGKNMEVQVMSRHKLLSGSPLWQDALQAQWQLWLSHRWMVSGDPRKRL